MKPLILRVLTSSLLLVLASASQTPLNPIIPSTNTITKFIPPKVFDGPVNSTFSSHLHSFDSPKLSSINSTSFEWWYFDIVSPDLSSSICVVFYTSLPTAFIFLDDSEIVTVVGIYTSFANGSLSTIYLEADQGAVVTTAENGDGSSGVFTGSDFTAGWEGSPDMKNYTVTIDAPNQGVMGTFQLISEADAHYHCGAAGKKGTDMRVGPQVGWNNAIPGGKGSVNFMIEGGDLAFEGVGYHDKNWGDQPWHQNVGTSYWGHAHLGPYSIVWFDLLTPYSKNYVSAYVSLNNTILTSSCAPDSAKVRPTGKSSTYPPTVWTGAPEGFSIQLNLGDEGILDVNVTNEKLILGGRVYYRWIGSVVGRLDGGELMEGVAVLEEFALSL